MAEVIIIHLRVALNVRLRTVDHCLFYLFICLQATTHTHLKNLRNACLDYLWALYDSLSADCFVILLGDFNGDLGNSLGDLKVKRSPMIVA